MLVYNFSNWCQSIGLSSSLYYLTDENTIHKHAANLQSKKDFVFWHYQHLSPILIFPSFSTSLSNRGLLPSSHLDSAVRVMPLWADPSTSPPLRSDVMFLKQSSTFSCKSAHELVAHDGSLTCVRKTLGSQRAEDRRSQVTVICARIRGKINKNKGKKYLLMYDRKPQNSVKQLYFT